ncbi:hypothetical protein BGW36DRAFT_367085 [Talaromyces proteolyticus]|uniref:Uncharacterized protein n=1 Tax=Talaromyces proteolyticus TaxID=1131652 RepID=A0AAD4L238_9EURO|nr:uncharacterized protein BGW36DRAFT_367085 [Talaromyces proteolyticus]KAH8705210.1 hypothetical protein BGW36DRAFT_367085 [Talaromyces proteolyticus]
MGYISFIFLLIAISCVAMKPYPLGINFGPNHITAAYITAANQPVVAARLAVDDEYRALIADSIENEGKKVQRQGQWYLSDGDSLIPTSPDPDHNPKLESIFAKWMDRIHNTVNTNASIPNIITSISIPQHFNGSLYSAVGNAALKNEEGMIRPWQTRHYYNAARLAYHLNSCQGLGLDSRTCHIEDGPHLVLFLDYNESYLEFFLADVGEFTFINVAKKRMEHLKTSTFDASNADGLRNELLSFIDRNLRYDVRDDLRAIVFSGDAAKSRFQELRNEIIRAMPEHATRIRDSIDPALVGAIGAAEWAKLQVQNPKILKDIEVDTTIPNNPVHDEL